MSRVLGRTWPSCSRATQGDARDDTPVYRPLIVFAAAVLCPVPGLAGEPLHDGPGQRGYGPGLLLAERPGEYLGARRQGQESLAEDRAELRRQAHRCLEQPVNEIGVPVGPDPLDQVALQR